jgi:hypothetical protein
MAESARGRSSVVKDLNKKETIIRDNETKKKEAV